MTEPAENQPETTPEPANTEVSPEGAIRALQAVIEQKDAELATLKDQALRALAETENTRRRSERELADMSKYAVTGFARDLVGVLENLQRALDAIPAELKETQPAVANLAVGVDMTLKELLSVFARHGIKRIDPMGQKFDHNFHQAVAQVDAPDAVPGNVVQVMQAGYVIHDRLLRPAMVAVAAGAPAQPINTSA